MIPAAPAPFITIFVSLKGLFTIFKAFITAARAAIDVPCWSSLKTGKMFSYCSPLSILKHSGDLKSYRFIALYRCIRSKIASIAWAGVLRGLMQTGTTFTSPSILNIKDLAYITGSPGIGPIFPSPRTEVPSVTIALSLEETHSC